jgi:polyhydroxyalkanoate synthase
MQAAPHRIGEPAPLVFHLGVALAAYGQALLAAPRADSSGFPWIAELGVERNTLAGLDQLAVAREIAARLNATVAGLEAWQRHPYRRDLAPPRRPPTRPARRSWWCRA